MSKTNVRVQDQHQSSITSEQITHTYQCLLLTTVKVVFMKNTLNTLHIVADQNIAYLQDYFNLPILGVPVKITGMSGREITADVLAKHQPDALLIRSVTKVDAKLLANNDSVQFVGSATIGTDHVATRYLAERGIGFVNAIGCSKHSVAQYVLTAILTLRPQHWHQPMTLGIIGMGNIGWTLAQYATDLGWQVLAYDPFVSVVDKQAARIKMARIKQVDLPKLLTNCDAISLHVPLTNDSQSPYPTHYLIDANALAITPVDTLLINTARGQVVNEADLLADMIKTKRQVVLDVFEHEPVVSVDLLKRLHIATPHIAGYTLEGKLRGTQMIYDGLVEHFGLNRRQDMVNLLPNNPYHWQHLKQHPNQLPAYYDIMADNQALHAKITKHINHVIGADFDALRKNYPLRREWCSTISEI